MNRPGIARPAVFLIAIAAAGAMTAAGASAGEAAPKVRHEPGVTVERTGSATVTTAFLPGRLIAYALPRGADGRRSVFLLVAPVPPPAPAGAKHGKEPPCDEDPESRAETPRPRVLIRLDEAGAGSLQVLREDLPADAADLLAADVDGDGKEELLLGRPGEIDVLRDAEGRRAALGPDLLLADPDLDPDAILRDLDTEHGGSLVVAPVLGGVRFFAPTSGHGGWGLVSEAPLPVRTTRKEAGLRITSPLVRYAGRRADGHILFAAGPESHGKDRLRTILIDPAADPNSRSTEAWSRFPAPERIIESAYLILDGRPALVATTRSAEKLSFFEEKMLRVYYLDEPDRSRSGSAPLFAAETRINLWQEAVPSVLDVDRDGREDLVIGYWKGIKNDHVVLDAYLREAGGGFAGSPRSTEMDVEEANRSVLGYGRDLDGDGLADLVLNAGGKMLVYPGSAASREGKRLLDPEPRWSLPTGKFGSGDIDVEIGGTLDDIHFSSKHRPFGSARLVDLEGAGRITILIARPLEGATGVLRLVRLAERGPLSEPSGRGRTP